MSGVEATVFGLDVRADTALPFLQGAGAKPTGRALEVSLPAAGPAALEWPETGRLISDQRHADGSVSFQIERSAEAGYRLWGPLYGTSLLSADGRELQGAVGSGGMQAWQRLLIGQALPFAAVVHGLEVWHASAVVVDRAFVAFAGPSGSGKTSLALALCRRGADLLADDVLALERVDGVLIGHPGTPVAGVDRAEAERLRGLRGEEEEGELLGVNSRERLERVPVAAEPAPLGSLFFLDRCPGGPAEPRFEAVTDVQQLLAATFNLLRTDPERLVNLLDVCALAARGRVERVTVGLAVDATELGAAVERRIGAAT